MTVVCYDPEKHEHITIENVWKIEQIKNHLIYADGIKVYYIENAERKGMRISNCYVTSINA